MDISIINHDSECKIKMKYNRLNIYFKMSFLKAAPGAGY